MLWANARLRHRRNLVISHRVAEVRAACPESEAWLGLLEAALAESERGPRWEAAVPPVVAGRPVDAPLLHGAEIRVGGAARAWVRRVLKLLPHPVDPRRIDALALLEAALSQDDARIDQLAGAAAADAHTLRVVGQVAAMPLLQACNRALHVQLKHAWWEGYCSVCGAWPTIAEFQGLERRRWLRCGRCGAGWEIGWLRCPFCGQTDHEGLGYLAPDDGHPTRRVEYCKRCQGYVKGLATVRPFPPWAVVLEDALTVPLDIAALERGFRRPERPGYALGVRVVERPARRVSLPFSLGRKAR